MCWRWAFHGLSLDCLHVSDALRMGEGTRSPMSRRSARKFAGKDLGDGPKGGRGVRVRALPTDGKTAAGTLGPTPSALPFDQRAEIIARLERGLAEVRAGRDVSWEDLDRRTRAKFFAVPDTLRAE